MKLKTLLRIVSEENYRRLFANIFWGSDEFRFFVFPGQCKMH